MLYKIVNEAVLNREQCLPCYAADACSVWQVTFFTAIVTLKPTATYL